MFKFSTKLFVWKNRIKKNGYSALNLCVYISCNGKADRYYHNLQLEWPHDKIDFDTSTLLPRTKKDLDVNDYNMIILSERSKLNDIAKIYRMGNRMITVEALKRELLFADSSKSIVTYFELRRKELYRRKEIGFQTYKNYGTTIGRIREFDELARFEQIDTHWMSKFKAYLKGLGNAHNTVWTRIKDVKALLRVANEEVTISVDPAAINYENRAVSTPIVFLNRDEIKLLTKLLKENTLKSEDQNILKAFLFSCYTSLRVSDIYAANKSWMLSDNFLLFTMAKNKDRKPKTVKIPIAPFAKELIDETLNTFFKLPTEQEYNRTLKEIASKAGIKKRLTSHVGRHTFGYLFMTSVGDIYGLKEIMGHSKIETTQRYAHLDEEYKLDMVMKLQASMV